MVEVTVQDVDGHWKLSRQKVVQLPLPGDRAVIGTIKGIDIWEVLYVEHHPIEIPTPSLARPDPYVVVVRHFEAFEAGNGLRKELLQGGILADRHIPNPLRAAV